MRMRWNSVVSVVTAAVLGAAMMSGCSSTKDEPTPTAATQTTSDPQAAQEADEISRPAQPGPVDAEEFQSTLKQGMSTVTTYVVTSTSTVTSSGMTVTSTSTTQVDNSDPSTPKTHLITDATSVAPGVETPKVEVIGIGTTVYTSNPDSGTWTKTEASQSDLDSLDGLSALSTVTAVEFIGAETVDGTDADHYLVTTQMGPMDFYIASGRLLKLEMSLGEGMTATSSYSAYGEPLSITAPDPSLVVAA
ncbi:hypothetical protein GCM10009785_07240 [Brooklawnia cerclae]|uniref:Outer membrane lipoprotein-sorting protein n=1 Tax=Brooklawnia cerclae TaxID=349934 RepID=A0ABX0SIS8_9ACTN|nr:hypothetical protein [Brooklawnia cerclae]NIH58302.1 outer membrane lipoprotein-sorting protein [Brooklawnia cerclae]